MSSRTETLKSVESYVFSNEDGSPIKYIYLPILSGHYPTKEAALQELDALGLGPDSYPIFMVRETLMKRTEIERVQ